MTKPDTVVVLAAGQGTRMRLPGAKVLHAVCGRPLVAWVLDQARALDPRRMLVVIGHEAERVSEAVDGWARANGWQERVRCVLQEPQNGTGHALLCCLPELGGEPRGLVVVLYGDMPLLQPASLERLCAAQADAQTATGSQAAALLVASPPDPRGFGRILRSESGDVLRIVEERDATPAERAVREVNLGVYAFPGAALARHLPELDADNAQGELYLTDVAAAMSGSGGRVVPVELEDAGEAIGVNTLAHLAEARRELQLRILLEHMHNGVQVEDLDTTFVDHGVEIGAGTRILPCTVIRGGVKIGAGCEVGPFTHLRVGTVLEDGAEVGNFTEAKQARLGGHSKAKHLSYLGDVTIGARVNIGAGTIFANYDGVAKHHTTVEDRSFVGSGTIVVAPARVGEGATTGAGAVVTRNTHVGPDETWVGVPARRLEKNAEKDWSTTVAFTTDRIVLISGTANPDLAEAISAESDVPLANAYVGRFPDGEVDIKVSDDIRGGDVFVIQPTCPPVNDNWIELLLLLDCLRRASAGRITAVMPYYGYARKDRKDEGRVPISAKVVANTLVGAGADRLLTLDMHAAQIQGFYDIPVDHLYARPVLMGAVRNLKIEDPVIVTPDVGGIKMARAWAKLLGADLAIVDKRRVSGSEITVEHMIGDVEDRNVIIVDDMISTGGSISEAARIVRAAGARQIVIAVSHGVFCGPAVDRLDACPADCILITDTIPQNGRIPRQAEVVTVAGLFAQAILNIHRSESVSSLFDDD